MAGLMIPATEMDALYRRVKAAPGRRNDPSLQAEQLAFARELERDPGMLAESFASSVATFARYSNEWTTFYDPRPDPHLAGRNPVKLGDTKDVAAFFARQRVAPSDERPGGALRYVDREVVPARSTGGSRFTDGRNAKQAPRLDLLLADADDGAPVIAEVKVGGDQHAFYALVQLLMLAAQSATRNQRARLVRHYPGVFDESERIEVCLLLAGHTHHGQYRTELGEIAERLSAELMCRDPVAAHIRAITCFDLALVGGRLELLTRFTHRAPA